MINQVNLLWLVFSNLKDFIKSKILVKIKKSIRREDQIFIFSMDISRRLLKITLLCIFLLFNVIIYNM